MCLNINLNLDYKVNNDVMTCMALVIPRFSLLVLQGRGDDVRSLYTEPWVGLIVW